MSPALRWQRTWSAALLALAAATSTAAAATVPWLSARGSAQCPVEADALAARVAGAVLGELNPELRVDIVLHESKRGVRARVALSQGSQQLGRRWLDAASCDEALRAVVAVTALALSATAPPELHETASSREEVSLEPRAAAVAPAPPAHEPVTIADQRPQPDGGARAAGVSLSLGTGVSLLGGSDALLSLGAALRTAHGAWRAQVWYGLPSFVEEEQALPARSLQARRERGALALDYCRQVDTGGWLSLCGGLELGVARRWSAELLEGEARQERSSIDPWLAAALGSRLSYPRASWQPGIELSTLLPLHAAAEDRRFGLRALAGVAVPF